MRVHTHTHTHKHTHTRAHTHTYTRAHTHTHTNSLPPISPFTPVPLPTPPRPHTNIPTLIHKSTHPHPHYQAFTHPTINHKPTWCTLAVMSLESGIPNSLRSKYTTVTGTCAVHGVGVNALRFGHSIHNACQHRQQLVSVPVQDVV